ncbi:MAG: UvrB/UvrC motif-containing protein [Planctomycetota bacterium]|nr:UvrB/UvrC motif-containing protein [Planctomycetota bacterium]
MNVDITELLQGWPFEPGKINVRLIESEDGEQKIQVRLDLGVLQMELDGRPDGQRPLDHDSLLEYFEARLDRAMRGETPPEDADHAEISDPADAENSDPKPDDNPGADTAGFGPEEPDGVFAQDDSAEETTFTLSAEDCRALREEAVQYYHRYVALLVLEDFDRVIRDTTRNLRVLDICHEHAAHEDDRTILEQFRPYITMMRARALASQALADNETKAALHAIDEAIETLRGYFSSHDSGHLFDDSGEVQMLREMRDSLIPKLPVSQKSELRQRLQRAIEDENYELASILRDELKMLPD